MNRIRTMSMFFVLTIAVSLSTSQAQDLTTARDVLEANIEATGGMDAWNDIKDIHMKQEIEMEIPQGVLVITSEMWMAQPEHIFATINLVDGPPEVPANAVNSKIYAAQGEGWVENGQGRQPLSSLPASQRMNMMNFKNELGLLERPDSTLSLLPDEDVEGSPAYVVQVVMDDGAPLKYYYDKESNLLVAQETTTPMGTSRVQVRDHRVVGGLSFSHEQVVDLGGMGSQTMTTTQIDLNQGVTTDRIKELAGETGGN